MLDLKAIYKKSSHHKEAVLKSELCGCFSCLHTYPPSEIKEWVRSGANHSERTCAVCPYCSIDAVLPGAEVDLAPELLKSMQSRWFSTMENCLTTVFFDEANDAKATLESHLGKPDWLRGVWICKDPTGLHMVKVGVSKDPAELCDAIPKTIEGVRVIVDEVGDHALLPEGVVEQIDR